MSHLEDTLALQLRAAGIKYEREFKAVSGRKYCWDFAIHEHRLLIEVQGGIYKKGGHSTGKGITRDCEKANLALLNGWQQITVVKEQIKSGQALKWIQQAIRWSMA